MDQWHEALRLRGLPFLAADPNLLEEMIERISSSLEMGVQQSAVSARGQARGWPGHAAPCQSAGGREQARYGGQPAARCPGRASPSGWCGRRCEFGKIWITMVSLASSRLPVGSSARMIFG